MPMGIAEDRGAPQGRAMWTVPALAVVLLALLPGIASGATDRPDPGRTTDGTVTSNGTEYPYLLYTPTTYKRRRPAPLLVVVHGCQTTAQQEMELTLYNRLAERKGFVVLYPEVDEVTQRCPVRSIIAGGSSNRRPTSEAKATRPRSPT